MKRARAMSDLRGFSRLAVEATMAMTDLVEEVHRSVTTVPEAPVRASVPRAQPVPATRTRQTSPAPAPKANRAQS